MFQLVLQSVSADCRLPHKRRNVAETLIDGQGAPAMLKVFLTDARKQSEELRALFEQVTVCLHEF